MSVIETNPFIEFKQQFNLLLRVSSISVERLCLLSTRYLQTLYYCGGRGIGVAIQELATRLPSVQACDMIGLCSCIDLQSFLSGLLETVLADGFDRAVVAQVDHNTL